MQRRDSWWWRASHKKEKGARVAGWKMDEGVTGGGHLTEHLPMQGVYAWIHDWKNRWKPPVPDFFPSSSSRMARGVLWCVVLVQKDHYEEGRSEAGTSAGESGWSRRRTTAWHTGYVCTRDCCPCRRGTCQGTHKLQLSESPSSCLVSPTPSPSRKSFLPLLLKPGFSAPRPSHCLMGHGWADSSVHSTHGWSWLGELECLTSFHCWTAWKKTLELEGKMVSTSPGLRDLATTWLCDPEQVLTPEARQHFGNSCNLNSAV